MDKHQKHCNACFQGIGCYTRKKYQEAIIAIEDAVADWNAVLHLTAVEVDRPKRCSLCNGKYLPIKYRCNNCGGIYTPTAYANRYTLPKE